MKRSSLPSINAICRMSFLVFCIMNFMLASGGAFAANDIFHEDFDSRQENATLNNIDGWLLTKGSPDNAITQSDVTSGNGKSLAIKPAEEAVTLSRISQYGNIRPAWVEYIVRPGIGGQENDVPSTGIGSVTFNYNGAVNAADGSSWVSLGQTFDPETWYRVIMKIDFDTKTYAVYLSTADRVKSPFIPDKDNLRFIDSSISSINQISMHGVFKKNNPEASYLDDLVVHFIERVQIVSPSQEIVRGRASEAIWIQLQNSNAEPQTAFRDLSFELLSSSAKGSFSLTQEPWEVITQVVIPEGSQSVKFYYKDETQGKPVITVNEYPERGWIEATQSENVLTAGNTFSVSSISPQIAGEPFTVTVTAKDDQGEVDTTYAGTLVLTPGFLDPLSGSRVFEPSEVSGFQNGIIEFTTQYADSGSVEILVQDKDDAEKSGTSGPMIFLPKSFRVTADSAQIVNKPFRVTLEALNSAGLPTPNYNRGVRLEALSVDSQDLDGGKLSVSEVAGNLFNSGSASADLVFDRVGKIQIQASDALAGSQRGLSDVVSFVPKALKIEVQDPPEHRDYFYVGEAIQVFLEAVDYLDKPISNFESKVAISSQPDLALPLDLQLTSADQGKKSLMMSAPAAGNYLITIKSSSPNLEAVSPAIQVRDATVQVNSTTAPVGSTEIEIELVDEKGQRIKDSRVTLTVILQEENPNNSAISSATEREVVFNHGIAKIDVMDLEAETVTVIPKSLMGFKIRSGTIIFGRIGKSGIGSLMWWEVKDEKEKKKELSEAAAEEEKITLLGGKPKNSKWDMDEITS